MRLPKSGCVAVLGNKSIRIDTVRSVMGISACCCIFFKGVLGRLSRFSPIWCAIIWCIPLRSVLNYLGPVAPCRSNRDGKIRQNRSELQKDAERQIRRKARKRRKAQKGTFWGNPAKKSVQIVAAQLVVDNWRLVRSGLAT